MFVRKGDKLIRIMYMSCPCATAAIKPLAKRLRITSKPACPRRNNLICRCAGWKAMPARAEGDEDEFLPVVWKVVE